MKPVRVLAMLAWLPGCGMEFSEPLVDTAARLSVAVALTDSVPHGEARLSGFLWPGFDAKGAVRTPTDSSIRFMGRTIGPYTGYSTDSPSDILYSDQWTVDPDAPPGLVEVQAPAIAGLDEPTPLLRLIPPWRAGPTTLTVAPGSSLRLDLSTAAVAADTISATWSVYVTKDGRLVAQLGATGATPSAIDVPWAMLSALVDSGQVKLMVYQRVATPLAGRRYVATLAVSTAHVWSVTIRP